MVREDLVDHGPLRDERHDPHRAVARRASERVDLAALLQQRRPSAGSFGGRESWLNLLDNDIKFSPDGATVYVEMSQQALDYVVSVADAGPGTPESERERVFERLVRLDTARSRTDASATIGAGLGLAVARRIAELHGGRLVITVSHPRGARYFS